jgi:hypothetical protein
MTQEKGERPALSETSYSAQALFIAPKARGASRRYGVLINFIEAEFMQ